MQATVRNMRKCVNLGIDAVMFDSYGNHFSVDPGDYFDFADDYIIVGEDGEEMELLEYVPATFKDITL